MRRWIFSRSLILLLIAAAFLAHADDRTQLCQGMVPPNNLWIPDDATTASGAHHGITKAQFNEILDRITAEYASEISRAGGNLKIERKWTNGTVNAYAYRDDPNLWVLAMFGGMARYPLMTYDAFVSVACHETGHHLGGVPRFKNDWASVEGESDYYAATKCMKRLFAKDDNKTILDGRLIDPDVTRRCALEHRDQGDQLICARVGQAGIEMGAALADMDHDPAPKVTTPSKRRVKKTFEDHPLSQCRTDTYFHGALCSANPFTPMSGGDPYANSCAMDVTGARPLCWYKP